MMWVNIMVSRLLRTLFLGVLLTPFVCFWSQDQGIDRIFSLMVPPVAITMVIAILNAPFRSRFPRFALNGADLMVLYAMLATACAMSAEWMDMIPPQVYGFAAYQEQNGHFKTRVLPYVSEWLFFTDPEPLKDFRDGGKTFAVFWAALPMWLPKIAAWTTLLGLLTTAMLCINALLREQWIHQEKLAFPIVQLPLALADDSATAVWRDKLFWICFAITFGVDMLNGISFLYPSVPRINIRFIADMNSWFSSPPWNQTGWTPIGLFPFVSALGVFMPTDLLFSLLFFFFVRKGQQIIAYSIGNEQGVFGGGGLVPSPPYFSEQSWGAFLGLFLSFMWLGRSQWKRVWQAIGNGKNPEGDHGDLSYRFAFYLLIASILGLGAFGMVIGLPFFWVIFYVVLFLIFSVAVTRLRAQLGAPTHEMAFMGPHQMILDFTGSSTIPNSIIARTLTTFHFMNRIHRTHPMPTLLEGMYLADRTRLSQRFMFMALWIAAILGFFLGFIVHVYLGYRWTPVTWISGEVGGVINSVIGQPRPPNLSAIGAVAAGFAVVWILDFVRFRVPGFWLHPAGYALAMNFGIDYYWFGLLIVLIAKVFIQRYYGLKGYGRLRIAAFGLIFGEFAAELIWALFSMLNDRQITYSISFNGKMSWDQ